MKKTELLEQLRNGQVVSVGTDGIEARQTTWSDFEFQDFFGDCVSLVSYEHARGSGQIVENDNLGLADFLQTLDEYSPYYRHAEGYAEAIEKHLSRAGVYFLYVRLQGYSQSEWHHAYLYSAEVEGLSDFAKAVKEWYRGDIWQVSIVSAEIFTSDKGNTRTEWNLEDLSFPFLESDFEAEALAAYERIGGRIDE